MKSSYHTVSINNLCLFLVYLNRKKEMRKFESEVCGLYYNYRYIHILTLLVYSSLQNKNEFLRTWTIIEIENLVCNPFCDSIYLRTQ